MARHLCLLGILLSLVLPAGAFGQGIEGGAERYAFEAGDQTLYEAKLDRCPVGEFLPEWRIAQGSYECARFQDRIWIRPLEEGTVLYLALEKNLPDEFSLEFTVYAFEEAGRPALQFALHPRDHMARFSTEPSVYHHQVYLGGKIHPGLGGRFGAQDRAVNVLTADDFRDFRHDFTPGRVYRMAVQVRRGQARFFVDGKRIGHKPFRPEKPIGGLSLHFSRYATTQTPYKDAPVLVTDIRLAAYSRKEAAPQAEQDLIRALGGRETPEALQITLAEAILFDFGKWALKPEATQYLDQLAQLARIRSEEIRIEGHTDNVGNPQFNRVLSELRAHVVALALAQRGVDPKRLHPQGFGETRPVASNDTEEGRARNRRVEVLFIKK